MYSFDHDLGHFVSIGPATVSEDGATLTSNPGLGIVKAGWHCGGDPAISGTTHDCPACQRCSGTTCIPDDAQGGLSMLLIGFVRRLSLGVVPILVLLMPSFVAICGATPAFPSARSLSPEDHVLNNPTLDLLVLEILHQNGAEQATVRIEAVLRGRLQKDDTATATWGWQRDMAGGDSYLPPAAGTKLLAAVITARPDSEMPRLRVVKTFAATPQNIRIAKGAAVDSPSPWPTVGLAVVGWILVLLSRFSHSSAVARLEISAAIFAAIGSIWAYVLYEGQMSPYVTIRLDLLVIWPAVLSCFGIPLFAWWSKRATREQGGRSA